MPIFEKFPRSHALRGNEKPNIKSTDHDHAHPFALQHTSALIESVFPAQKVSFESQRERKAGAGRTLTELGSYWKGRKPLIVVRAIVLGSLLPSTGNGEKTWKFTNNWRLIKAVWRGGPLANNAFKPKDIMQTLTLTNPGRYFAYILKAGSLIGCDDCKDAGGRAMPGAIAEARSPSLAIDTLRDTSGLPSSAHPITLRVLTAYTHIGDEDATTFALRPRQKGQVTVVDEIVQQASEAANSLLIPEGLQPETWNAVKGIQRFYLRKLDIETTSASKLDNYQNFTKAFHVEDYTKVMASMAPNKARLISVEEFTSHDLSDSTAFGPTYLGKLIIALQQLLQDKEPQTVIDFLHSDVTNFLEARPLLIDMTEFIAAKTRVTKVRDVAEILSARLRNQRLA